MRKKAKKVILHTCGWALLPIGVAGILLPIIPGIVLFALGIFILACVSPTIQSKLESFLVRYPKIHKEYMRLELKYAHLFK